MIFGYLILFVAVLISAIAAYYSVVGLTAIFAAAVIPVMIMGGALEAGKIVATVWLHNNWQRAGAWFKLYLIPAIVFLMLLTSMGIFGFLSKAHSDMALTSGDVTSKIALYDEKIKIQRENIEANRRALKQMDEAVDQVMGRSSDERGAERAVQIRRSQQKERTRLLSEIEQSQKAITSLNEQRAPIAAEVRKVEAEVGPIKYIAALIYGDNPDQNLLEAAVRWVIILIVIVFDPLALTLILAGNKQLEWARQGRGGWIHDEAVPPVQESPDAPPSSAAEDIGKCPKCSTPLQLATGIGPFCPNKECDVVDGIAQAQEDQEQKELDEFLWRGKMIARALDAEEAERLADEANAKLQDIEPDLDVEAMVEQAKEAVEREQLLNTQIQNQKDLLDTLADEFVVLEARVSAAETAREDLANQLAQAEQVKADIKTAFDATTVDRNSLAQDKAQLQGALTTATNSASRLQIDLENKQLEIQSLQAHVDSLQRDLQAAVALAAERNQLLNDALSQLPPPRVIVEEIAPVVPTQPEPELDIPVLENEETWAQRVIDENAKLGYEQKYFTKYNAPATDEDSLDGNAGFGSAFPTNPNKGDVFLRVDYLPTRLYKYNGSKWIEIDKDSNDRLAYNTAYIEHLIQKIRTGEYDIDDLNEAERNEIEQYLRNNNAIL
jgi:hypothetical protein